MSAAMLFSLLSVTVPALLVAANVAGLFHGISDGHSTGLGPVASGVSDSAVALRNGLLIALACLAGAGAMSLRAWGRQDGAASVARPAMSGSLALRLSGLLGVILIGVDQLLRAHHAAMVSLQLMIDPGQFRPGGRVHAVADGLESSLSLLLVGGAVLTAIVLVSGVMTWRATRSRAPHRLFTWVSRAAIVIAVAGAAYHARVVVTNLASFNQTVDQLRADAGLPPR
jgi:hypothetical protein